MISSLTHSGDSVPLSPYTLKSPRGYICSREANLYYLQSRYCNPVWGRFINADALVATGQGMLGNNMFAYCNNNPVIFEDTSGHALKPCTVVINDGDSGLSSIDLLRLKELSKLTGLSPEELGYSTSSASYVYEYEITVNISLIEFALMGENDLLNLSADIVGSAISDSHPLIALCIAAAPYVTKPFLEYVHFASTPKLPNGTYTVYAVDTITSTAYINDVLYPYKVDFHAITLIYDLKNQSGTILEYREIDHRFYTEYVSLGG